MKTMQGDLVRLAKDSVFDLIAHGCNCFCTMGAGIALQIKKEFPKAYQADLQTKKGNIQKLGTCSWARTNKGLIVVNAYTQFNYGGRGKKVDYYAIESCMEWIKDNFSGKSMGFPLIGCGLAGGEWNVVRGIIENKLKDEEVTIVEYKK